MIDLHLHLDGSIHPEDMFRLAEMSGAALPAEREEEIRKMLMVEPGCRNLGEYLEKFALPLQVLQTKESMEYAVYRLLKRLRTQGLCYVEIRFAPQLHTQKGLTQEICRADFVLHARSGEWGGKYGDCGRGGEIPWKGRLCRGSGRKRGSLSHRNVFRCLRQGTGTSCACGHPRR